MSVMRSLTRFFTPSVALLLALLPSLALAAPDERATEAPRFELRPDETGALPSLDALPLKATEAHIDVAGMIAHVTLEQTWANEGDLPLTATYVFPAGTRAAVVGMRMRIGERTIVADIAEKADARERYEAARDEGRTASLLEERRPNVLALEVANILPGDVIEITVEYTELIVPSGGVYELVFPQVVGPRYGDGVAPRGASTKDAQASVSAPYRRKGSAFPWRWAADVRVSSAVPVREIASPSHGIAPRAHRGREVELAFEQGPRDAGGDRDLVLRWRLAGDQIETGVLLYRDHKGESFFAAVIEPPRRVTKADMPPRELVFIVDVSGSMEGFPLDTTRTLVRDLLSGLREQDSFNILFFSGAGFLLAERSLPATAKNLRLADETLDRLSAGGGTELVEALQTALALPTDPRTTSRTFVVVTDGYVAFEKSAFRAVRENLGQANLFAFGIGSSVNRYLIEGLARAGLAEPFIALDAKEAKAAAKRFQELVSRPALTDIEMRFEGFDAYDVEPRAIPDVFADRPVVVFGKYRGGAVGRVRMTGLAGGKRVQRVVEISDHLEKPRHRALRSLWARQRVADLVDFSDADDDAAREVTRLGLTYSLLTPYTSFVAVDSARRGDGSTLEVQQPLPLPAGVGDMAVPLATGFAAGGSFGGLGIGGGGYGSGALGEGTHGPGGPRPKDSVPSAKRSGSGSSKPRVLGSMTKEALESKIRPHRPQVHACYEKALANDPSLEGRIVLDMKVGVDGRVREVSIVQSSVGSPELERCVSHVLSQVRFEASNAPFSVRYPFVFKPE